MSDQKLFKSEYEKALDAFNNRENSEAIEGKFKCKFCTDETAHRHDAVFWESEIAALEAKLAESKKVIEWQKLCIKERERKLERAREALTRINSLSAYADTINQAPVIAFEALKELS